jgi:hypothetical protein
MGISNVTDNCLIEYYSLICNFMTVLRFLILYEGVSKSFRTESITKSTTTKAEKQHKGLWRQNSLE